MQTSSPVRQPTSVVLGNLFLRVPAEHVTLEWLLRGLGDRSFGVLLLLLALLGALPGVSVAAGLLLPIPAYQMLRAHPGPVLPRSVARRPIGARRLTSLVRGVVPVLRLLERVVHPRWTTPVEATKRVVGAAVLPVSVAFFVPLPLSNIAPAAVVALIAFLSRAGRPAAPGWAAHRAGFPGGRSHPRLGSVERGGLGDWPALGEARS